MMYYVSIFYDYFVVCTGEFDRILIDVSVHPKVKLFISHGGISGTYETVDAGVPVLGFPLLYDQPRNIQLLVEAGMAISMDIFSMTTETLLNAINELINNKK